MRIIAVLLASASVLCAIVGMFAPAPSGNLIKALNLKGIVRATKLDDAKDVDHLLGLMRTAAQLRATHVSSLFLGGGVLAGAAVVFAILSATG